MKQNKGIFAISLDFELYWGMRDVVTVEAYRSHLEGTPDAVDRMLDLFTTYHTHVTWATVGFLFARDVQDLISYYPKLLPQYTNREIDLYDYITQNPELENALHFAPKVIQKIAATPNQEVATHTFSHYYCLENGQNENTFAADLRAAQNIAQPFDIQLKSLVFPRNQYNEAYLNVIKESGITSYRGNEEGFFYDAANEEEKKTPIKRLLRLVDSYLNLSGYHTYDLASLAKKQPYNIPASRFLRSYSAKLAFLDGLKLKRIKEAMTHAAQKGELFHLWWHPHNFGTHTQENIAFLEEVLKHYLYLKKEYGFRSMTMDEISESFLHF